MTTRAGEKLHLSQHLCAMEDRGYAIYNPQKKPIDTLPIIYGFNNGGDPGWYKAVLLAEDGKCLGSHICSHEGYMEHDLGILQGSRPERHECFKEHYPDGYRMDFVPGHEVRGHAGLLLAFKKNQEESRKINESN